MSEDTKKHSLEDHLLGLDAMHSHEDGEADHDHDHDDVGADYDPTSTSLWAQDNITLLSVGTAIARPNGVGVTRGAPHPNAAVLFYDFELSPEGQQIIANREFVPTSRQIDTPLNKMPMVFVDARVSLDEYDKWKNLYTDLFGRDR